MRLGLLADIHEDDRWLTLALERFRRERVERVVALGDMVLGQGEPMERTVDLLRSAGAVGVWGNHDFGLCHDPPAWVREHFPTPALDFLATFRPRLEIDGCLFTHVEPWLDPFDLDQLWDFNGLLESPERATRNFESHPHRLMFMGHVHRWMIVGRAGRLDWDGTRPIVLPPGERYLVVIAAVCDGRCAVFDTTTNELVPIDLGTNDSGRE